MEVYLPDPQATDAFAARLAHAQTQPAVIWLKGDLGAGKSAFSRAYLRALGVSGSIKSPTYTLAELYDLPNGGQAAHLDLYRLSGPDDLEFLGLPERAALQVVLVEWPEQGASALGAPDLTIALDMKGEGRRAQVSGTSDDAREWLQRAGLAHAPTA